MDREAAGKLWKLHKNGFPGKVREAVSLSKRGLSVFITRQATKLMRDKM